MQAALQGRRRPDRVVPERLFKGEASRTGRRPGSRQRSLFWLRSACGAEPVYATNPVLSWKALRERLQPLPAAHDPRDKRSALEIAYTAEPLYTGVVYKVEKPTLASRLKHLHESALKRYSTEGRQPNIAALMERYI